MPPEQRLWTTRCGHKETKVRGRQRRRPLIGLCGGDWQSRHGAATLLIYLRLVLAQQKYPDPEQLQGGTMNRAARRNLRNTHYFQLGARTLLVL